MKNLRIAVMMEGASCVALSVVLSYLTLFRMPQGGSINLALVPIFVFAYRHGAKWGILVGALTGFLKLVLGGYIVHPVQAILEYPAAYAAIGLAGLFKGKEIICSILAGLAQFACYVVAGAVFFASYAPAGTNAWAYAAVYNGTFLFPKIVISIFAAIFLWNRLQKIFPVRG